MTTTMTTRACVGFNLNIHCLQPLLTALLLLLLLLLSLWLSLEHVLRTDVVCGCGVAHVRYRFVSFLVMACCTGLWSALLMLQLQLCVYLSQHLSSLHPQLVLIRVRLRVPDFLPTQVGHSKPIILHLAQLGN